MRSAEFLQKHFISWNWLYAVVIGELGAVIILLYFFARVFR